MSLEILSKHTRTTRRNLLLSSFIVTINFFFGLTDKGLNLPFKLVPLKETQIEIIAFIIISYLIISFYIYFRGDIEHLKSSKLEEEFWKEKEEIDNQFSLDCRGLLNHWVQEKYHNPTSHLFSDFHSEHPKKSVFLHFSRYYLKRYPPFYKTNSIAKTPGQEEKFVADIFKISAYKSGNIDVKIEEQDFSILTREVKQIYARTISAFEERDIYKRWKKFDAFIKKYKAFENFPIYYGFFSLFLIISALTSHLDIVSSLLIFIGE